MRNNGAHALRAVWAIILATTLSVATQDSHGQTKPKEHVVIMEAVKFTPETVEVKVGDTITWKNKDAFPHTATAEDRRFDSGSIGANRSWKFKANKKGVFPYVCTLHPTMKGTLVVN